MHEGKSTYCKPHIVFILGMHRSGTSCLAGSLERCGLYLGAISQRAESNPKGFVYELEEVNYLHEEILIANGGTWYLPPTPISVSPHQKQALERTAAQLAKYMPCGLKDPRVLLLLNTWTEIVDLWTLVGIFRHPVAVARSLVRRHKNAGWSEEVTYPLWVAYNSELVRWHREYQFPIVEYDLSDGEAFCRTIAALAMELGLGPDIARLREFVSSDLDHNRSSEEPVPEICQEIYTYLRYHRYKPNIWDDGFERKIFEAQQRYNGWRWSPNRLRQAMHFVARFLPSSFVRLGRRLIRI